MKKILAVYGTLKLKYSNNYLLENSKFLGEFKTEPNYTLYGGGFPIIEREGNTPIHVELFEVNDYNVLKNVQSLEGFSGVKGHHSNWYDVDDDIITPYGMATMFVMDKGKSGRNRIIKTGIWES